jgi:hypothetical protein
MFGRIPQYDPRNENFPFRAALTAPFVEPTDWPVWAVFNKALNQGQTGTCVGHATKHWMLVAPTIQTKANKYPTAFDLYLEACKNDPWSENDNGDLQFGTSVLSMFQVLKDKGYVNSYVHTRSIDDVRLWLKTKGPIVMGTDWLSSMMQTTNEGILKVDRNSPVVGGHAWILRYWSKKYDAPVMMNSWGNGFGKLLPDGSRNGHGVIDPDDLLWLINRNGDCVAGTEVKVNG